MANETVPSNCFSLFCVQVDSNIVFQMNQMWHPLSRSKYSMLVFLVTLQNTGMQITVIYNVQCITAFSATSKKLIKPIKGPLHAKVAPGLTFFSDELVRA